MAPLPKRTQRAESDEEHIGDDATPPPRTRRKTGKGDEHAEAQRIEREKRRARLNAQLKDLDESEGRNERDGDTFASGVDVDQLDGPDDTFSEDELDANGNPIVQFSSSITSQGVLQLPRPAVPRQAPLRKEQTRPPLTSVTNRSLTPRQTHGRSTTGDVQRRQSAAPQPNTTAQDLTNNNTSQTNHGEGVGQINAASSVTPAIQHEPDNGNGTPAVSTENPVSKPVQIVLFRDNVVPTGKPKARHYEDRVALLLLRAIRDYECRIFTINPFPDAAERSRWAKEAWTKVCEESEANFELSDAMAGIIKGRGSRARGELKDKTRPLVAPAYGLIRVDKKKSPQIAKNKRLYESLMEHSAFMYKDTIKLTGYAQNQMVREVIHAVWFRNKLDDGVIFSQYFNPISLVTLALVLTAVEFCLEEWSTGQFTQDIFSEKDNKTTYETHLQGLKEWDGFSPPVVLNIRKKMHDRARQGSGATALNVVSNRMTEETRDRAKLELEGRTGETDSEESGGEDTQ